MATKRATICLDAQLHRALRLKAAETDTSISDLVNEAVKQSLASDPRPPGCQKLSGAGKYRVRQG